MTFNASTVKVLTLSMLLVLQVVGTSAPASGADAAASKAQEAAVGKPATLNEVLNLSNNYFSRFPFMMAEQVYEKIVKGGDHSYLLVSVQSPGDYAKGHIPGAINIPFQEIAEAKSLARLPRDKKIVLSCEDGHRSMASALFLGQLGYETYAVSMGLGRWNSAGADVTSPYPGSAKYPVSTVEVFQPANQEVIAIAGTPKDARGIIVDRTRAVLSKGQNLFIDRSEVYEKAVKGGDKNYLLVSLQKPEDYAKGHVPGAINIPPKEVAKVDTLRKLPRDKKIVLICYVGHWAGSAAMFLNQLGYEAYDMRFGTLGWNDETAGLGENRELMIALGKSLSLPVEKE